MDDRKLRVAEPGPTAVERMNDRLAQIEQDIHRSVWEKVAEIGGRFAGLTALVIIPVVLGWYGETSDDVRENRERIRVLEAKQYSREDAAMFRAEIVGLLRDQPPPRWLTETVQRMEAASGRMADQVGGIERRMHALEAKLESEKR